MSKSLFGRAIQRRAQTGSCYYQILSRITNRLVWPVLVAALPARGAVAQTNAPVLTVRGAVKRPLTLALSDLQTTPRVRRVVHERDGDAACEGVLLYKVVSRAKPKLTEKCRGNGANTVVVIKAADNYQALFSWPELDPKFGGRQVNVIEVLPIWKWRLATSKRPGS
jgi:hypothetical protein